MGGSSGGGAKYPSDFSAGGQKRTFGALNPGKGISYGGDSVVTITPKKEYVLGFFFDRKMREVLLINKTRPETQRGKLNGVGGKVEIGETPVGAMIREFKEEVGLVVTDWRHYSTIHFTNAVIYVYSAVADIPMSLYCNVEWPTDETPEFAFTQNLPNNVMTNLRWLIPMAGDVGFQNPLDIYYNEGNDK